VRYLALAKRPRDLLPGTGSSKRLSHFVPRAVAGDGEAGGLAPVEDQVVEIGGLLDGVAVQAEVEQLGGLFPPG